ncbi:MAG: hypothetical protein HON23_00450 [Rickettsiales bacterium]|jgi:hypothetical protein|nr:hypothetical protein [Rickettsiales bacterium]
MVIKKLKAILFAKIVIILVMISGSYIFSDKKYDDLKKLDRRETKEISELKQIKAKIYHFNTKTEDISEALATWEYITDEVKEFNGLKLGDAKEIIDRVKKKHNLNQLDIKLSKPEILQGKYKGVKVGVESTILKIKIRSYTDIQVFYFLYDILVMLPGYPQVIKFSIKKSHDLNDSNLYRIARDPKFSPVLSEIDIRWNDLKSL